MQTHTWLLDLDGKTGGTTTCLGVGRKWSPSWHI